MGVGGCVDGGGNLDKHVELFVISQSKRKDY